MNDNVFSRKKQVFDAEVFDEMLGISSDLTVKHDGFMDVSECLGMLLCLRGIDRELGPEHEGTRRKPL